MKFAYRDKSAAARDFLNLPTRFTLNETFFVATFTVGTNNGLLEHLATRVEAILGAIPFFCKLFDTVHEFTELVYQLLIVHLPSWYYSIGTRCLQFQ
jgi:hypothetical protein